MCLLDMLNTGSKGKYLNNMIVRNLYIVTLDYLLYFGQHLLLISYSYFENEVK